ncbi:MAG: TRAP transporter large permease [bacterium]|nr:TRAP transporter large permease [bacterium]
MQYLPVFMLFILFALNVPVAFAIAMSALIYFFITEGLPLTIFIQKIVSATHSFPLLAVPFFITAGTIMNYGGITKRLMALADALTGHMAGGLAQVNIVLSTLMGGLSGSANADAAMQSKILVPEMIKRNYDADFSAVVTACSSVIAPIIPPGIGLILYGFLADQSVGRLFIAGIVPGIMMCFALMYVVSKISVKRQYVSVRNRKASKSELSQALKDSLWAMVIPVGIIGGIRFGIFTPTEAGAMTVVYALLIGFFAYKDLKIRHIPDILLESVLSTSVVMLIICAASAFGFYMAWERIPMQVAASLANVTQNPWLLLLIINVFLIIVGMFVEGSAALILLTPLLVPIVDKAGVDLVHFGIVMVLNLTIAGVTPPLGTLMYATCSIIGVPVHKFSREVIPFLLALFLVLFLITFIPILVLFLPNLIMGN